MSSRYFGQKLWTETPKFLVAFAGATALGVYCYPHFIQDKSSFLKKNNSGNFQLLPVGKLLAETATSGKSDGGSFFGSSRSSKPSNETRRQKTVHMRFDKFASMEYRGEPVMTPMDFIESVTQASPRPRIGRRRIDDTALEQLVSQTSKAARRSTDFFRKLDAQGVITFPEYCFLIACLAKTRSSIEIAFKVFDRDDSSKIEKSEFEQFAEAISDSLGDSDEQIVVPKTTLSQLFFGNKGTGKLSFANFFKFIRNLQTEILEVEFVEFSKGLKTISEDEFARILLRHTTVSVEEQDVMLDNLVKHGSSSFRGVTFEEFSEFFYFLNNLDDFTVAVRMNSYAGKDLTKESFQRAYKITNHGKEIPSNMLDTIFLIFDTDNNGELSKREFIGQMKDAVQRGFRYHQVDYKGWNGFKNCVSNEMKLSTKEL